jgi:hypothetical protein
MDPFIKNIKRLTKTFHVDELISGEISDEICEKCKSTCNAIHFRRNFENWTSGNNDIDKFIQNTQLLEHTDFWVKDIIEWIPYDRFRDIKYIAEGGFNRASWIDGYIQHWNNINQDWMRNGSDVVFLKSLNNSINIMLKYNEV